MRKSTTSIIVVLLGGFLTFFSHGDLLLSLAVPVFFVFHEYSRRTWRHLGPATLLSLFLWVTKPTLYLIWFLLWSIADVYPNDKKTILSKDGKKKIIEHKNSYITKFTDLGIWNLLSELELELFGANIEAEYIGDIDPQVPIMDENSAMQNLKDVKVEMKFNYTFQKYTIILVGILLSTVVAGSYGLSVAIVFSFFLVNAEPRVDEEKNTIGIAEYRRATKLPLSNGVYRLSTRAFDIPKHRGIGYVKDGILHTRYHVTEGNSIEINGEIYPPAYINRSKDNIAYGGGPLTTTVATREEIIIALAGPNSSSIVAYKSKAETDSSGNMVFFGNRSIPGCSGSPIFRIVNVTERGVDGVDRQTTNYVLVGTIGWFYDKKVSDDNGNGEDERISIEIAPSDPHSSEYHVRFVPDGITQVFKHPGAGKTRTIGKELVEDGLNKYGRVYFTGPTRVVCTEAYKAFNEYFKDDVSLCTSSASVLERGSGSRRVVIMAHATALNMLAKGSITTMKKGLWIMDESHFMDSKTLVLKDYLRHKVAKEHQGALVEMTATGYDINKGCYVLADGSNTEINDVIASENAMVSNILEEGSQKKVMVFVTAKKGKAKTTATSIATAASNKGINYVILSRDTFDSAYPKAKDMAVGIILTTDISECGANIHPDIVYDFQITSKVVSIGKSAVLEKRAIDQSQRVQRRGRVGRVLNPKYPATYVSPGLDLPQADFARIEHHERFAAAKALGIEIRDPVVRACSLDDITLTADQIAYWAQSGGLNSLRAVHMLTNQRGMTLGAEETKHRTDEWMSSDDVDIRLSNKIISCGWFDYRDRDSLQKIAAKYGKCDPPYKDSSTPSSLSDVIARILKKGGKPVINGLGIINPYGDQDSQDENKENKEDDEAEVVIEEENLG